MTFCFCDFALRKTVGIRESMMKSAYGKPLMHFMPLADGIDSATLSEISDKDFETVFSLCAQKTDDRLFQVSPEVIKREIEGEWLLVPTGTLAQRFSGVVSLSEVGNFIWELLQQPHSMRQVIDAVKEEYEDEAHMIEIETRKFIDQYTLMGFITKVNPDY